MIYFGRIQKCRKKGKQWTANTFDNNSIFLGFSKFFFVRKGKISPRRPPGSGYGALIDTWADRWVHLATKRPRMEQWGTLDGRTQLISISETKNHLPGGRVKLWPIANTSGGATVGVHLTGRGLCASRVENWHDFLLFRTCLLFFEFCLQAVHQRDAFCTPKRPLKLKIIQWNVMLFDRTSK